jgi:hypothetical protein
MPKDEKYEKENGKYQLYINERYKRNPETKRLDEVSQEDKWVKFEESYKYDPEYKRKHAGDTFYQTYHTYKSSLQEPIDYSFKKDFPDED